MKKTELVQLIKEVISEESIDRNPKKRRMREFMAFIQKKVNSHASKYTEVLGYEDPLTNGYRLKLRKNSVEDTPEQLNKLIAQYRKDFDAAGFTDVKVKLGGAQGAFIVAVIPFSKV